MNNIKLGMWLHRHLEAWAFGLYPDPNEAADVVAILWNTPGLKDLVSRGKSWAEIYEYAKENNNAKQ